MNRKTTTLTNETHRTPHTAKKTILAVVAFILLIPFVMAIDLDNKKDYDPETRTVTITNLFGYGGELARIRLVSEQVVEVFPGKDRLVAELEFISFKKDYKKAFKDMEFYNVKNNVETQRDFVYKKKVGDDWEVIDSVSDLSEGDRVGIFTDVYPRDYVEWIPTLFGVRIEEWASWTDSLNKGLIGWWRLDETAGVVVDELGLNNGSIVNTITRGTTTIIGNSFTWEDVAGSHVSLNTTNNAYDTRANFTVSFWANSTFGAHEMTVAHRGNIGASANRPWVVKTIDSGGGTYKLYYLDTNTGGPQNQFVMDGCHTAGTIYHFVFTRNDSTATGYCDGVRLNNASVSTGDLKNYADDGFMLGLDPDNDNKDWNGNIDEFGYWNRTLTQAEVTQLYNGGVGLTFQPQGTILLDVTLNHPADNLNIFTSNDSIQFNASTTISNSGNITNATLWVYNVTGLMNNTVTNFVTGVVSNESIMLLRDINFGTHTWNVLFCGNKTDLTAICSFASANRTFTRNPMFTLNSHFTDVVFETQTQFFEENVSIASGFDISSAKLVWNGTERGGSFAVIAGQNYTLSNTFDIPVNVNRTTFFSWNVTFSDGTIASTNISNQTVDATNLTFCNSSVSPIGLTYFNFSFRNETTNQELVNATVDTTWTYWLGTGSVNKTLTFANTTENANYKFCFYPGHQSVNTELDMTYNNAESQQRSFELDSLLSNITTEKTLFLLPTGLGIFQKFAVVDNVGNPLSGVLAVITRTIGGETIDVASGLTDSSGFVSMFLNPDASYSAVFSKIGFLANAFTFTPTSETRTVIMGGGDTNIGNGTVITTNTTYEIFPVNSTLNNGTLYNFGFNVSSTQPITFMSMNITNSTGAQFIFQSRNGQGAVAETLNTGLVNDTIIGYFEFRTADETLSITKRWRIGDTYIGDYSIFRQFTLFNGYGFAQFWRILLALAMIIGTLIFLSSQELVDSGESKVAVVVLLVWAFSIVSWLDTGLIVNLPTEGISRLGQFSSQYGIAILTTAAGSFFLIRRLFRIA